MVHLKYGFVDEFTFVSDLSQFRPVYAPKDFLEVIASLKNPNVSEGTDSMR